jgi:hypothetical protein
VTSAYEILGDRDKRRWYDLYGSYLSSMIAQKANDLYAHDASALVLQRDESVLVSVFGSIAVLCALLVLLKSLFTRLVLPVEWILFAVLSHFLLRLPLPVKSAVLPAVASLFVVSTAQLPSVVAIVWWLSVALCAGARSGCLDLAVGAGLVFAVAPLAVGLTGQLPDEWSIVSVLFTAYGRIVLGALLINISTSWFAEIEPRAAWHRDDAQSRTLALVTSLGVGGVPAALPISLLVWVLLWRVDGWLGVRVEYFVAALAMIPLTAVTAAGKLAHPTKARIALVAMIAAVALVYNYELPATVRLVVQLVAAVQFHFLEASLLFGLGAQPTPGSADAGSSNVVAPDRVRAIVGVFLLHVIASFFLHPVSLAEGPWQLGAMLFVICGLSVFGVDPLPQLLRCAVTNSPLTFVEGFEDDDEGDEAYVRLEGEDDDAYRLRRMLGGAAAAAATASTGNSETEKAAEFFDTLQMAKAELVFKERLRLNEMYAASADDSSLEVSFESWNAVRSQLSKDTAPPKVATTPAPAPAAAAAASSTSSSNEAPPEPGDIECFVCHRMVATLKRCGACLSELYCSLECQKRDWAGHKETCKQLQHISKLEERWHNDREGLMRDAIRAQEEREREMRQRQQQAPPEVPESPSHSHSHAHGGHSHSHSH